jgi:hypothetical protein
MLSIDVSKWTTLMSSLMEFGEFDMKTTKSFRLGGKAFKGAKIAGFVCLRAWYVPTKRSEP